MKGTTMLVALNQRLLKLQRQQQMRQRLQRRLALIQEQLHEKQARLELLQAKVAAEQQDVDQLEQLSLTRLFYALMRTKVEQLDKERQELMIVQLQYQDARAAVETLAHEETRLAEQLKQFETLDAEYLDVLNQKARFIANTPTAEARELLELSAEIATKHVLRTEIAEAIMAARQALEALSTVAASLTSAGNWGTYDMLGGGLFATMLKHDHLDDARKAASRAQRHLEGLRRELDDINVHKAVLVELGGFETFADYFFDGLLADWMVQSKIRQSEQHVAQSRERLRELLSWLQQAQRQVVQEGRALRDRRRELLETTA
jgi:hypothetical protein